MRRNVAKPRGRSKTSKAVGLPIDDRSNSSLPATAPSESGPPRPPLRSDKIESGDLLRQLRWMTATACALAFIPLLHRVLGELVRVPVRDDTFLKQTFLLPPAYFQPEPLERLTFLLGVILMPILILAALRGLARALGCLTGGSVRLVWMTVTAAFISAAIAFAAHIPAKTLVLAELFPVTPHALIRGLVGFLIAGCALLFGRHISRKWAAGGMAIVIIGIGIGTAAFTVATTNEGLRNYIEGPNMDAILYSDVQVEHGRGMLIDLTNQYGLYPQFLDPTFRIIGLNVLSFTVTMWTLMSACFVCVGLLLWINIENKWIAPVALLSVAHYAYFSSRTWLPDDPYLQYHPIRFLFPCVGLYLFARYIKNRSRTLYGLCAATAGLAILWNPDSGIAVFGAWIALLLYQEFSALPAAPAARRAVIHVMRAAGVFLSLIALYSGYAFIRYHAWPHWGMLTVNVPVFYRYGGMMLPLPPNHPWILVIALYTLTLARAGQSLLCRKNSPRQQLMFVTTVLGTGLFTYYQGRSHDNNLVLVIWPAIILSALSADELFSWCSRVRDRLVVAPVYLITLGILWFQCFPIVMIPDVVRATNWATSIKIRSILGDQSGPVRRNIELLRHYAKPNAPLAILSYRAGVYLAETGAYSIFTGPSLTEMLWRSNLDSLEKQLAAVSSMPLLVDSQDLNKGSFGRFPSGELERLLKGRIVVEQNLANGGSFTAYITPSNK
jgi:hypothetical protein